MVKVVLIVGGVLAVGAFVFSLVEGLGDADRDGRIRMPGEAALRLEPGKYGIYYEEHVDTGENEVFEPPDGIRIRVRALGGAPQPDVDLGGLGNQIGTDNRTAEEIGTLEVEEEGRYGVVVGPPPRPAPEPAITIGESAGDALKTGAIRSGILAALTAVGVLLVLALRRVRGGGSPKGAVRTTILTPPAQPEPPAVAPRPGPDEIEQLERLAELRKSGAISAEEFERLKMEVLNG